MTEAIREPHGGTAEMAIHKWFIGPADDRRKSSRHLIGAFGLESALVDHEAVAEVAVICLQDETMGEVVSMSHSILAWRPRAG